MDGLPGVMRPGPARGIVVPAVFFCALGCQSESVQPASLFEDPSIPVWQLSEHPALSIGGSDERSGFTLHDVRGAALAGDRVIVADGGVREVRGYALTGELLSISGGQGSGPGEFQDITALSSVGDNGVAVWDRVTGRITHLDREGTLLRSLVPDLARAADSSPEFVGALPSGRLVFRDQLEAPQLAEEPTGERRDPVRILVLEADGTWDGLVFDLPGSERWLLNEPGPDGVGWGTWSPVFARSAFQVIAGEAVVMATNDSLEFSLLRNGEGVAQTRVFDWTAPRIAESSVEAARARMLNDARTAVMDGPDPGQVGGRSLRDFQLDFIERMFETLPHRDSEPAFQHLLGDAAGRVWIAEFVLNGVQDRWWLVLNEALTPVGRIRVPVDVQLLAASAEHLVTHSTDTLARARVDVYTISRPR